MARKTCWILTGLIAFALGGLVVWAKGKPQLGEYGCPYAGTPMSSTTPTPPSKLVAELPPAAPMTETKKPAPEPIAPKIVPAPTQPEPPSGQVSPMDGLKPLETTAPPPAPTLPGPPSVTPPSSNPSVPSPATPTAAPPSSITDPTPPPPVAPLPPGNIEPARYNPAQTPESAPITNPASATVPAPAVVAPCPWVLKVEIIDGRTQLEARTEKEVQFRVSCERLNLQAPNGTIEAQGGVKVASLNLDGSCERLTITWQDDKVQLQGQVRLKCRKDGQEVELTGDKVSVKLTTTSPAKDSDARKPKSTTPAAADKVSTQARKVVNDGEEEQEVQPFDGDPESPR